MSGARWLQTFRFGLALALGAGAVAGASARARAAEPALADGAAGGIARPGVIKVTAVEALTRAIGSPRVGAALHGVEIAKARAKEASRLRLPVLDVTSIVAPMPERRGDPVMSSTPDSALFGVNIDRYGIFSATDATLVLPLSYWRLAPASKAAGALVTVAEGDVERTKGVVWTDTAKAYYGALLLTDLIGVVDDGRDKIGAALKTIDEGLAKGDPSVSPIDRHKVEAFKGELEGRYYRAVSGRATVLSALGMLVGSAPGESFEPAEEYLAPLVVDLAPLDVYLARAEKERPELMMVDAGLRARTAVVWLERGSLLPDVGLVGTFAFHYSSVADDQLSPFAFDPYNHLRAGVGLGVKWTLDLGAKLARVDRAKAELAKLEAERDAIRAAVRLEVERNYRDVEAALAAVKATEAGLKAAGKWLFTVAAAFGIGTAESRELLEALLTQGQLAVSNLQAMFDLNVGVVTLEVSVGGNAASRLAALTSLK